MRSLALVAVVVLSVLLAAALTRPSRADFERFATDRLLDQIARMDIEDEEGPLGAAALAICKLKPRDCYGLILSSIRIDWSEASFWSRAAADWNGRGFACTGAFGRFWCRDTGA